MALHARAPFIHHPDPHTTDYSASHPEAVLGKLLSVGRDERLLLTRAGVLRTTGCEVVSAHPDQAPALLRERQFRILVIGHSLSDREATQLALQTRTASPATKLLMTCIEPRSLPVRQLFDAVVDIWAGPVNLVAAVRRLLAYDSNRLN